MDLRWGRGARTSPGKKIKLLVSIHTPPPYIHCTLIQTHTSCYANWNVSLHGPTLYMVSQGIGMQYRHKMTFRSCFHNLLLCQWVVTCKCSEILTKHNVKSHFMRYNPTLIHVKYLRVKSMEMEINHLNKLSPSKSTMQRSEWWFNITKMSGLLKATYFGASQSSPPDITANLISHEAIIQQSIYVGQNCLTSCASTL